jgi:hypothetical protein
MRTCRRFQPLLDGLSYRIAPSSLLASPAASLLMSHANFSTHAVTASNAQSSSHAASSIAGGLTMSCDDTDMPETGSSGPIIAGPPPGGGDGTQLS